VVIVKHVVERATSARNFLVLMKMNYYDWAMLMWVMLQARGMWTAVSDDPIDFIEDRMSLDVISKVVPVEMMG
jgi:hypothetical protein